MNGQRVIINVSNRLPVTVGETLKKSSGGLVAALEGVDSSQFKLRWLGWPGQAIDDPKRRADVTQQLDRELGCVPIFMSEAEATGHYEGFSNGSLWPLLHTMPSRFTYATEWWDHYETVNRRFADVVLNEAGEDDLVWVHDYQLLLLPQMLREARPTLKIGFFLHTPFPSYEVFRCHPKREALLHGMLGADLIGFHTFGYLRHFRSAAVRLLGVEAQIASIPHARGSTALGVYPIGINTPAFETARTSPAFEEHLAALKKNFGGKRIVLSVERLDYSKGLPQRLDAIEKFLAHADTEMRNGIKFIFISVPSRENVDQYQQLLAHIELRVGQLNGDYSTTLNSPIHFIHGSVQFPELCALYALADVALVTPLADGMNLVAKEYIICQQREPGVLVLSEFAGAAQELFNAMLVNPYDTQAVADVLRQALDLPLEERRGRMEGMIDRVRMMDAGWWAKSFIDDLAARVPVPIIHANPAELRQELARDVRANKRVALFLDYDGSLRELQSDPAAARPSQELIGLLRRLQDRANLRVTIISGRRRSDLERFVGQFDRIALIAEHGAAARAPGATEWTDRAALLDFGWMPDVLKILQQHASLTPGSFVEHKQTSLVWHYRRADPEFGDWKARQLVSDLTTALANHPVHVRHGKKIVEITPHTINKGAAVMESLAQLPADVALAVGDDTTDESMFVLDLPQLRTLKIGNADTAARYVLPTPAQLRAFLTGVLDDAGVL
ncbi:MAG TPA: bifunctional alpha,alpha-trehalose-phosphate synthase (UDP-forming)/trehalose-phosphatase [Tepidisphaeraceae bacterium]|jgi:trehalose 6-phosphate synthase/phosphatase